LIFENLGYGIIINGKLLQIHITMFANGGVGKEGNMVTKNKPDFQRFFGHIFKFLKRKNHFWQKIHKLISIP
jgi:hypothetical protein